LPPAGQRKGLRRASEKAQAFFVDRFSSFTLAMILLLIVASIADAVLTIELLRSGSEEVNPLMRKVLAHGLTTFLVTKYLLTVVGLPLLLILGNQFLFGTRLRVRAVLPVLLGLYAVLIGYQICLLNGQIF
jgi:hypothetical protein